MHTADLIVLVLYAAVVLETAGLPRPLFSSTFAVSRTIGWTAHFLEQTGNNRIIRPKARYAGPVAPEAIPAMPAA